MIYQSVVMNRPDIASQSCNKLVAIGIVIVTLKYYCWAVGFLGQDLLVLLQLTLYTVACLSV